MPLTSFSLPRSAIRFVALPDLTPAKEKKMKNLRWIAVTGIFAAAVMPGLASALPAFGVVAPWLFKGGLAVSPVAVVIAAAVAAYGTYKAGEAIFEKVKEMKP